MRLRNLDRLILVWLYRVFPYILNAITVVKPETVCVDVEETRGAPQSTLSGTDPSEAG